MGFKCGIVGLPNVGKSTLFNALTNTAAAEAANYPFCTIEPNVGSVAVPDERLNILAKFENSQKILPARMNFVDIAGLVKGASQGEGLGNKFLGHIREVDAIVCVVRCFEHNDIVHIEGRVDPVRDAEIIKMELTLADLEVLQKRLPGLEKKSKVDKSLLSEVELVKKIIDAINNDLPAHSVITPDNAKQVAALQLLTTKPYFFVGNVLEPDILTGNSYIDELNALATKEKVASIMISAQIESEIANLSDLQDRQLFLQDLGLEETGLAKIVKCGYDVLNLSTFFTVGPKEAHAWTIKNNTSAPQAAGVIHSDFERGFICAEVLSYKDYVTYQSLQKARDAGKLRIEGKDYKVCDGDVMHFKFNV